MIKKVDRKYTFSSRATLGQTTAKRPFIEWSQSYGFQRRRSLTLFEFLEQEHSAGPHLQEHQCDDSQRYGILRRNAVPQNAWKSKDGSFSVIKKWNHFRKIKFNLNSQKHWVSDQKQQEMQVQGNGINTIWTESDHPIRERIPLGHSSRALVFTVNL